MRLPDGFLAGHHTDRDAWTGCTVLLAPEGSVAAGEVRGGGPGTRESDLLSPATNTPGPQGLLLTGGSAFGLGAADGVVAWLREQGLGYPTPAGRVPLVSGAVLYDLMLGKAAWPVAADAFAACEAAGPEVERGSVGAGTGASAGKALGPAGWTKGGLGAATAMAGEATVVAIAAANPVGDVLAADGSVLAGPWRDGVYLRTAELIASGEAIPPPAARENTTLVAVLTDARLTKLEAWQVARATSAGVARAVSPCATPWDGDMTFVMASGRAESPPMAVAVQSAEVASAAIRDAILQATGAPGCPAASER